MCTIWLYVFTGALANFLNLLNKTHTWHCACWPWGIAYYVTLTFPESTTNLTPSIVTEVSAMFVEMMHFLTPSGAMSNTWTYVCVCMCVCVCVCVCVCMCVCCVCVHVHVCVLCVCMCICVCVVCVCMCMCVCVCCVCISCTMSEAEQGDQVIRCTYVIYMCKLVYVFVCVRACVDGPSRLLCPGPQSRERCAVVGLSTSCSVGRIPWPPP